MSTLVEAVIEPFNLIRLLQDVDFGGKHAHIDMLQALLHASARDTKIGHVMVPASPRVRLTFTYDQVAAGQGHIKLMQSVGDDIAGGVLIPALFIFSFNRFAD